MTSVTRSPRVVLISGCSSGIGLATADLLAQRGHVVYATARRDESLDELRQRFASSASVVVTRLDVTDPNSVDAVARLVRRERGRLDALINNAGYGQVGSVEDTPIAAWRQQFEVNVFGLVRLTQACLPLLRETAAAPDVRRPRSPRVVNVSSVVAHFTMPLMGVYDASKHALESVSAALRMELRGWGIHVVVVEPGSIATSFRDNVRKQQSQLTAFRTEHYAAAYAAFERIWSDDMQRGAAPPTRVAHAIRKAIESPRPRLRYRVTLEALLLPGVHALLPQRWFERGMMRLLGLGTALGPRRG